MSDYILQHHGIKGQKWGVRRYQNPDGTLTDAGKRRGQTYRTKKGRLKLGSEDYKKMSKDFKQISKDYQQNSQKILFSGETYVKLRMADKYGVEKYNAWADKQATRAGAAIVAASVLPAIGTFAAISLLDRKQ